MAGELVRYTPGRLVARKTAATLAAVDHHVVTTAHKIDGLEFVGELAISRAVALQAAQAVAEETRPNGTEHYAAIVEATMAGIKEQIEALRSDLR